MFTDTIRTALIKEQTRLMVISLLDDPLASSACSCDQKNLCLFRAHAVAQLKVLDFFVIYFCLFVLFCCCYFSLLVFEIGLLQLKITWYKIRHAGGQAHYYSRTGTSKQRQVRLHWFRSLRFNVPVR